MNGGFDRRAFLLLVLALVTSGAFLEAALRVFDPGFAERWEGWCNQFGGETLLNHAPSPGIAIQRLTTEDVYGRFAGFQYEETYDTLGIKRSALRPQDGEGVRVLFMGDSFTQGYDDANTVPQRAYEWIAAHGSFPDPIIVLNAGYSSYSPLIFTAQARFLLPVVKVDFLVIDIDETDLFDDAVRYRELVVRDRSGRIVAVNRHPAMTAAVEGCTRARQYSFRLLRLSVTFYTRVRLIARNLLTSGREDLFRVAGTPDGEIPTELRVQMDYFSSTLDELFATLKEYLPASRILVVRHPQLWHLKHDDGAPLWNRKVGEVVAAAAVRSGITFFDAQDELTVRFADHPEHYYWNGDMHFNFNGIRAYGELVGRELLRMLGGRTSG